MMQAVQHQDHQDLGIPNKVVLHWNPPSSEIPSRPSKTIGWSIAIPNKLWISITIPNKPLRFLITRMNPSRLKGYFWWPKAGVRFEAWKWIGVSENGSIFPLEKLIIFFMKQPFGSIIQSITKFSNILLSDLDLALVSNNLGQAIRDLHSHWGVMFVETKLLQYIQNNNNNNNNEKNNNGVQQQQQSWILWMEKM